MCLLRGRPGRGSDLGCASEDRTATGRDPAPPVACPVSSSGANARRPGIGTTHEARRGRSPFAQTSYAMWLADTGSPSKSPSPSRFSAPRLGECLRRCIRGSGARSLVRCRRRSVRRRSVRRAERFGAPGHVSLAAARLLGKDGRAVVSLSAVATPWQRPAAFSLRCIRWHPGVLRRLAISADRWPLRAPPGRTRRSLPFRRNALRRSPPSRCSAPLGGVVCSDGEVAARAFGSRHHAAADHAGLRRARIGAALCSPKPTRRFLGARPYVNTLDSGRWRTWDFRHRAALPPSPNGQSGLPPTASGDFARFPLSTPTWTRRKTPFDHGARSWPRIRLAVKRTNLKPARLLIAVRMPRGTYTARWQRTSRRCPRRPGTCRPSSGC